MAQLTAAQKKAAFKNTAKKNSKNWKESRKAKPNTFALPAVEPGRHKFLISGDFEIGKGSKTKGHAIAMLIATKAVTDDAGEYGVEIKQMYDLSRPATDKFDPQANLCRDLKVVMPDREDEIEALENPGDAVDLLEELNESPVLCWGTVSDSESNGNTYRNIRFNELVTDENDSDGGDAPADDGEGDEIDPDEPDADETDSGDDIAPEDDEPAEWEPAKDETITWLYRGKKLEGTILTVNRGEKTVRAKAKKDGRTHGPLPWAKIELKS